jgi:predicted RND superfamily exporter protein
MWKKLLENLADNRLIGQSAGLLKRLLYSRFTVKIIFASLIATMVWSAWTLTHLSTEYSVKQFYPKEHPLLKKDREIRQTFRLNEKSPFLYVLTFPKTQTWLEKSAIRKLQEISKELQELPGSSQTLSLTLVEGANQTKDELMVGNVFDRVPPSKWKEAILGNPLLYPLMVTSDFKSTLVMVEPAATKTSELVQFHSKVEQMLSKKFPEAQVLSAGVPLIQTRLSEMIRSELSKFLVIAVLVFCAIFYFLFSHWTAIVCAFVTLIGCNLFSLGLLAYFEIPMNVVLVTLPIITSVAVMSLLIHTLHLWSQKPAASEKQFSSRWQGSLQTLQELSLPNFLGAWTTALGFLALAPSHIPMIKQYGWTVAGIVGVISIYGQLFLLAALPFVQPKMRRWFDRPAFWSLISIRHAKKVILFILLLSVGGALLSTRLNFSGRLFDDLPKGDGVRASTEWIDTVFGGIVSYEVILTSPQEGFWKDPVHLQNVSQVAAHLRKHPDVGSVVTVPDFFQSGIPSSTGSVAETFFMFSMAEKNPLSNILTENAQSLRMMIRLKDRPTNKINLARDWIQASVRSKFPTIEIKEGGMATYAHSINQEVSKELVFGFWQSLLAIGLFLVVIFRSFRWAALACLPNFIPPALLMGSLALSHVSLKPGIALIFSIALGFAFNNTVYLLSRLRLLMKKRKQAFLPLKRALLMEANPCFFESFVMMIGFSIFLFSSFSMNQMFGAFMMISIVAGFLADLFFLPALLQLIPRLAQAKASPQPSLVLVPAGNVIPFPRKSKTDEIDITRIASCLALLVIAFASSPAQALTAEEILETSRTQLDSKDDQAKVEMKIIEKNGEVKSRVIDLKTLRKHGFSVLAKIQSPADIKGMGFLGHVKEGKESQWIYLPSSGQVRRVVTGQTKGGLLGSEISPEDLNSSAIQSATVKLVKTDNQFWWIEIFPAKGTSAYSKAVSKISKKDFLPQTTEYFAGNRLKKTVKFENYTKVGSIWRAQLVDVKNHLNGRGTQVKLSQLKLNSGLKSEDFSQSALKDD